MASCWVEDSYTAHMTTGTTACRARSTSNLSSWLLQCKRKVYEKQRLSEGICNSSISTPDKQFKTENQYHASNVQSTQRKKMLSSEELVGSTVNMVAKCFVEAHLGPLSQRQAEKKTKAVAQCVLEEQ